MNDFGDTQVQGDDEREGSRRLSLEGNQPPAEIDGYTMIRRLGTGAYGTVWLAREDNTGRMVAIKYYPHRRGLNWSLLSREVEKLAELYTSRNIVQLLDVGWNAEPPYYVMEFVENGSLSSYMANGPLAANEAVRIAKEVCRALIEAHGAGVLHCDLKPDNVLLDSQMQVRLCDFGQSRMSHERSPALGTLYYMAPEQADLEAIADARWDVYAVGALLYHMLTGEPPFRTAELQHRLETTESLNERLEVYRKAIQHAPPPATHRSVRGVDSRLTHLIDSCLAVDPAKRLPNAQAILAELNSRDQQRARRPLLLLGVLGPLLLMAAMMPIFGNALLNTVDEMERRLTFLALESDALSARIQGGALQQELERRLDGLERALKDPDLMDQLEALSARPGQEVVDELKQQHELPEDKRPPRPEWIRLLEQTKASEDETNRQRDYALDTSWFLTDRHGVQIWRENYSDISIGGNYSRRDYFHGRNTEYAIDAVPDDISPIEVPHVSLPFTSDVTKQKMVALSIPVRNRVGTIIGVFARTVHLADLQAGLARHIRGNRQDSVEHVIALADSRSGEVLDHPWLAEHAGSWSREEAEDIYSSLRLPQSVLTSLNETAQAHEVDSDTTSGSIGLEDYRDPVGQLADDSAQPYQGKWLAAMALMQRSKTPWVVIVQEKRNGVLRPVEEMKQKASRTAWLAIAAAIVLMGTMWLLVGRAIAKPTITPR